MIKPETIDRIRELSILDVVSKYNDIILKKAGNNTWKANSPFTNEKTPSFYVVQNKNIFKCFSSGKGGNAITFVMEKESLSYVDAIKHIAGQHGIEIEYSKNGTEAATNTGADLREAFEWATAHFCSHDIPKKFITERDLPDKILSPFKVGYALHEWEDLFTSAKKAGVSTEALVKAGLICKRPKSDGYYDVFRDRVMFPITDFRGNVIAFTGRDTSGTKDIPKYINSPDTAYDKSKQLYGIYQAIKGDKLKDGAYLVEGPTDVIRWHKHGFTNTVAPCGSVFTEHQAKLLKRFTDKLTIVPDNDADKDKNAGIEAMHRNARVAIKEGFTVKVLIPGCK